MTRSLVSTRKIFPVEMKTTKKLLAIAKFFFVHTKLKCRSNEMSSGWGCGETRKGNRISLSFIQMSQRQHSNIYHRFGSATILLSYRSLSIFRVHFGIKKKENNFHLLLYLRFILFFLDIKDKQRT